MDILFTYNAALPNTYGDIFLRAGSILARKGHKVGHLDLAAYIKGTKYSNLLLVPLYIRGQGIPFGNNLPSVYIERYDLTSKILEEEIQRKEPKLVISHRSSLDVSYQILGVNPQSQYGRLTQMELEQFFISRYWGKIQTNSHYARKGTLEFKEEFILRARKERIPHPKTVLQSEIPEERWNYNALEAQLGSVQIVMKDIRSKRGEGVYIVKRNEEFKVHKTIRIAQKKISNSARYPSSLRVITFPNHICGALIYYNDHDERSIFGNTWKRIFLNEGKLQGMTCPPGLESLLEVNGVEPNLQLNPKAREIVLHVSALPSQSLLRGIDIIGDDDDNLYVLEAQTLPGAPCGPVYSILQGLEYQGIEQGANVAARLVAFYMESIVIN